jgi:hypothetical protein
MRVELRANIKDHIYLRLCRLAVQAKTLANDIDKCSLDDKKLKVILENIEDALSLADVIREDGRRLLIEPCGGENGRTD